MSPPTVSVIIPVYNAAVYLPQALDSVLAQNYPVSQIIVIDDGTEDGMAEVARQYPRVTVLRQPHRGAGAARNLGLSVADGEIIAYIDADDIWLPHKLASQIRVLLDNPRLGYVLCRMRVFCEDGGAVPDTLNQRHYAANPPARVPSALVVWRAVADAVGQFDPDLETGEDADWFARANDMDIAVETLDEVLLEKRIHRTNISLICPNNKANLMEVLRRSILRKKRKTERKDDEL